MLLASRTQVRTGPTTEVIEEYVRTRPASHAARRSPTRTDRDGTGRFRFTEVAFESEGESIDSPATGQDLDVVLRYESADGQPVRNPSFAVQITTLLGETMVHLYTPDAPAWRSRRPAARARSGARCPGARCRPVSTPSRSGPTWEATRRLGPARLRADRA